MKKILLIFFLSILLLSFVSGLDSIPPVKQGQCAILTQQDFSANSETIGFIKQPSSNNQIINSTMTPLTNKSWQFSYCNTTLIGTYQVNGYSDIDAWNYEFTVTPTGMEISNSQALLYILIFFVALLLFIGLLVSGISIDGNNNTDAMTGYIIALNNMKYVKILCFAFAYLALMTISYFSWVIAEGFLYLVVMGNIFRFIFYGLAIALFPLFIVGTYVVIANWIRDTKLADMLSRGLSTK